MIYGRSRRQERQPTDITATTATTATAITAIAIQHTAVVTDHLRFHAFNEMNFEINSELGPRMYRITNKYSVKKSKLLASAES